MTTLKKLYGVAVLSAVLASASAFAADASSDVIPPNPGDVTALGPGGGDGGGGSTGTNCYEIYKDIYQNDTGVVTFGDVAYYRIRARALCDMRHPKLTDYLPHGLDVTYLSSGCSLKPSGNVVCEGGHADPGESATVYIGVHVDGPACRWLFNNACFTSELGGYACHGIYTWVRNQSHPAPSPTPALPAPGNGKPDPQLPDDHGFFPDSGSLR
jgi:hypothetical protein